MAEEPTGKGARHRSPVTDEALDPRLRDPVVLAWVGEHLTEVQRSVFGQRILQRSLLAGFMVGLAAHAAGYLLRSSATTEPLGLVVDLLYAFGLALWTGVVVVLFAQIIPESKRRQFKQALDAYEAAQRDTSRPGSESVSEDDGAPTAT